jgi:hypothetical protein
MTLFSPSSSRITSPFCGNRGKPLLDEGSHDSPGFHQRACKLTVWRFRNGPLPLLRTMVEILFVAKRRIKNLIGFPDQKQRRHVDWHGRDF